MLILIISGKDSVKEENIHVYLAPLIEELQRLWKGVKAIDGSLLEKVHSSVESDHNTNPNFKLQAILLWSIHDFPAYGLLAGQVTKGYKGCPPCGPHVSTRRSNFLGKNVYLGHCRYLAMHHPYRWLKNNFDGEEDRRGPRGYCFHAIFCSLQHKKKIGWQGRPDIKKETNWIQTKSMEWRGRTHPLHYHIGR